jgi:uncharacterized RDD family membrane protein YckC
MVSKPPWLPKQSPFFAQQLAASPAFTCTHGKAGLIRRGVAHLVDAVIALLLSGIVTSMLVRSAGARLGSVLAFASSAIGMGIAIATVRLSSEARATYGKRMMGIEVVRADGGPPSLLQAFLHATVASFSLIVWPLAVLLVLAHPDRRGLHELVAGTQTRRAVLGAAAATRSETPLPDLPGDTEEFSATDRPKPAPARTVTSKISPRQARHADKRPAGTPAVQRRKR